MKFIFLSLLIFQNIVAGNSVSGMQNPPCVDIDLSDTEKFPSEISSQLDKYSCGNLQKSFLLPPMQRNTKELKHKSIFLHYMQFLNLSKINSINNCKFHFIGPKLAENVNNMNDFLNHIELLQKSLFEFVDYMKNYERKMDDFSSRSVQKTKSIWLEHIKILNKKASDVISGMSEESQYEHGLFLPCEEMKMMGKNTYSNIKFFVPYGTITYNFVNDITYSIKLKKIKDFKSLYSIYNTLRCLGEMLHTLDVQFSKDSMGFLDAIEEYIMFNKRLLSSDGKLTLLPVLQKEMNEINFERVNIYEIQQIFQILLLPHAKYKHSDQVLNKIVIIKLYTLTNILHKTVENRRIILQNLFQVFKDPSYLIMKFLECTLDYHYSNFESRDALHPGEKIKKYAIRKS